MPLVIFRSVQPETVHLMKTPLEMRNEALETATTVWQDGLTVLPEGDFILGGRRLTLNEAILYSGNRRWFEKD